MSSFPPIASVFPWYEKSRVYIISPERVREVTRLLYCPSVPFFSRVCPLAIPKAVTDPSSLHPTAYTSSEPVWATTPEELLPTLKITTLELLVSQPVMRCWESGLKSMLLMRALLSERCLHCWT